MFKKTSLLAFFAMLFLVLVSFNVNAEQAEEAQKQTEEEDYDKMSEEQLRERIGDGDTDAMVEMGVRCFFEEEYTESRKLFQKAAKAGNSWGLRELGAYYSQPIVDDYNPNRGEKLLLEAVTEGEELAWFYLAMNWLDRVDPDESEKKRKGKMKKCVKYLEKSVEVGCAEGMLGLAYLYFDGNGVPQDSDKGISLLKKAIELGNPYAMLEMGCLYNCGEHVKQDTKLAKEWRDKAIKAGLDPEEATLDEPGDEEEVAENVAEEPVEELVEEVIKDYGQLTETKLKELINKDDTEAMVELGKRRYEKRNYKEAFTYFAAAANQGNVQGLLHCGVYRDASGNRLPEKGGRGKSHRWADRNGNNVPRRL